MQPRGPNPVTGSLLFILALIIWLVAGLTFLGPYVGAIFWPITDSMVTDSLNFTCPLLVDREEAIRAIIPNPDQQEHTFDVTFRTLSDSAESTTLCQSEIVIPPGGSETVTCLLNPVESAGPTRYLVVTGRARGETFCGSYMYPCVNSSQGSCFIAAFTENLGSFFGNSLVGLALLGASRPLLRRVHRFIRPVLLLFWLLIWLTFVLTASIVSPDDWVVIPFLIPSGVLLVGWLLRLVRWGMRVKARQADTAAL